MHIEQALRNRFKKVRKSRGKNGLEFKVCCPFCSGGDKKYKMYINPEKFGGCTTATVAASPAPSASCSARPTPCSASPESRVVEHDAPLPDNVESPGETVRVADLPPDNPAIEYLLRERERPFDPQEMSDVFGVRYCTAGKYYPAGPYDTTNTLIFPLWMFGRLLGWQSRLLYTPEGMTDDQCAKMNFQKDEDGDWVKPPKYWTSPGFNKGRVLWNFDMARRSPYVVVCEGVFDAMSVGPRAVATFGKGVSDNQAALLKTYWDHVILLLDPGDADPEMRRLEIELSRSVRVTWVKLKHYKDAGGAPRDEVWSQIASEMWERHKDYMEALDRTRP